MEKSMRVKLLAIQDEIGAMTKDVKNPFYKSKYFDINTLIRAVRPVLKAHEVILTQPINEGYVCSVLTCVASGEIIESALKLPEIQDPQKIGSAITYYRRYTLTSLLALEAEDDDGNAAAKKVNTPSKITLTESHEHWDKVITAIKTGERT